MQLTYYSDWDKEKYQLFLKELFLLADQKYLEFNKRIIFTNDQMIGIRALQLRKISKELSKSNFTSFLKCDYCGYFEELLIRGILLSYIKDYDEFILYLDVFIKYIDNWAICDMALSSYKIVIKNREKFINKILEYISSENEFIVRVGVIFLLDYYLVDEYIDYVFKLINSIKYRAYYVDMAIAWLISVAFVKYKKKTIIFLDNNDLDNEIIRMTIQKIRDSKRVNKYDKDYVLKYKKNKVSS